MTKSKNAKYIKTMDGNQMAIARLYSVDPPIEGARFVIVSAVCVFGAPETYIFEATSEGEITNWGELDGSYKGGLSHETALTNAGYVISET